MSPRSTPNKPIVAVTMGDPCGVGPEIIVKAFSEGDLSEHCRSLVVGDETALRRATELLRSRLQVRRIGHPSDLPGSCDPDGIHVISTGTLTDSDLTYGSPTACACRATIGYIETAVQLALNGDVQAICTCPIHKANLHRHGFPFPGHTEFLRELTNSEYVVMMLAGPRLRVSLVTIHEPLSAVPKLISPDSIARTIRITGEALLRDFGMHPVRLAVAGINPHAGEEGRFGTEEQELIGPAIEEFKHAPFTVTGPYPPDTLFHRAYGGEFDAVIAMYHDQGLIPIKLVHFHDAVNVSLGLPIIRTSVDHGTAYDLAGSGRAHEGSLKAAITLAATMAANRLSNSPDPG